MLLPAHKLLPQRFGALSLALIIHAGAISYLLHLQILPDLEPQASSIRAHIVANLPKNSENPAPLPLSLAEPVTDVTAPDVDIAPPREIYKAASVQMIDNLTPHSDETIIATTGPRPIPDAPNAFPLAAYPAAAKNAGQEGSVALTLQVSANGEVSDAQITKSSGYPLLDNAAARYAQLHWKFQPGTRNGVPVADWKQVVVIFGLQQVDVRY